MCAWIHSVGLKADATKAFRAWFVTQTLQSVRRSDSKLKITPELAVKFKE
jgi:hypothetical protein